MESVAAVIAAAVVAVTKVVMSGRSVVNAELYNHRYGCGSSNLFGSFFYDSRWQRT